jgi:predicted Zn finger-like uncharacterized protein
MEVSCPNCYAVYPVSPDKIPDEGLAITCERCEEIFTVVRSSGDAVTDRAQRMKGLVVLRDEKTDELFRGTEETPKRPPVKDRKIESILENKVFRLGVCAAGVLVLLCAALFFVWKHQVQSEFEKALRNSLAHASNKRFALTFDDVRFSVFGGLSQYRGCVYGLSATDLQTGESLKLVDRIPFALDSSKKRFITEPFNLEVKARQSKADFKGCVLEADQTNGAHLKFKVAEVRSTANGAEWFAVRGIEGSLDFSAAGRPASNEPFVEGDVGLGLRAKKIEAWSGTLGQDVDVFVSIKNGLFTKDRKPGELGTVNYADIIQTKWGENKAVAALERGSLNLLGSAVKLAGTVEFHNPLKESEADLRLSIKDFRHIMKYIHRTNERTFDKIVTALAVLEENKAPVYEQNSDSLDLRISYKNSRIELNGQEIQGLM